MLAVGREVAPSGLFLKKDIFSRVKLRYTRQGTISSS